MLPTLTLTLPCAALPQHTAPRPAAPRPPPPPVPHPAPRPAPHPARGRGSPYSPYPRPPTDRCSATTGACATRVSRTRPSWFRPYLRFGTASALDARWTIPHRSFSHRDVIYLHRASPLAALSYQIHVTSRHRFRRIANRSLMVESPNQTVPPHRRDCAHRGEASSPPDQSLVGGMIQPAVRRRVSECGGTASAWPAPQETWLPKTGHG